MRDFDPTRQAILETDAFDCVTEGILSQHDDKHVLHLVAFYGHSMVPAECNLHIYDMEIKKMCTAHLVRMCCVSFCESAVTSFMVPK